MNHFLNSPLKFKKMKNSINYFAILAFTAIVFFGSCARTKPAKSATAKNTPVKTTQATKSKISPAKEEEIKTTVVTTEKIVTETTVVVTEKPDAIYTTKPLENVAVIFNKEYPTASASVWNEVVPEGKNGKLYLVSFLLGDNRNSAIYNEKGIEVEKRSEILPIQLPHTVYDAIKNKYKDAEIISASTFHSTVSKGNYAAKVKSEAFAIVSEFILTEKGEFIEQ